MSPHLCLTREKGMYAPIYDKGILPREVGMSAYSIYTQPLNLSVLFKCVLRDGEGLLGRNWPENAKRKLDIYIKH